MPDRKMKRLSRADLLTLLIEQREENAALRNELDEVANRLNERTIALRESGNLAEAAMRVNEVFAAAQRTADQYLDNVKRVEEERRAEAERLYEESVEKCREMERTTEKRCMELRHVAEADATRKWDELYDCLEKNGAELAALREHVCAKAGKQKWRK